MKNRAWTKFSVLAASVALIGVLAPARCAGTGWTVANYSAQDSGGLLLPIAQYVSLAGGDSSGQVFAVTSSGSIEILAGATNASIAWSWIASAPISYASSTGMPAYCALCLWASSGGSGEQFLGAEPTAAYGGLDLVSYLCSSNSCEWNCFPTYTYSPGWSISENEVNPPNGLSGATPPYVSLACDSADNAVYAAKAIGGIDVISTSAWQASPLPNPSGAAQFWSNCYVSIVYLPTPTNPTYTGCIYAAKANGGIDVIKRYLNASNAAWLGNPCPQAASDVTYTSLAISNGVLYGARIGGGIDQFSGSFESIVPTTIVSNVLYSSIVADPVTANTLYGVPMEMAAAGSVARLAGLPNGNVVSLSASVVTAAFDGCFYIEDTNRTSGIKIVSSNIVSINDTVQIIGTLGTLNGERYISASQITYTGATANPIRPLGMNGGSYSAQAPMKLGLLLTLWGEVTSGGDGSYFYIEDGSGSSVEVLVPDGVTPPTSGYVACTGICRVDSNGNTMLNIRNAGDLQQVL